MSFDKIIWLALLSLVACVLRLCGIKGEVFQAFAHLLVGVIGGIAFLVNTEDTTDQNGLRSALFWMFGILCAVEVFAAAVSLISK